MHHINSPSYEMHLSHGRFLPMHHRHHALLTNAHSQSENPYECTNHSILHHHVHTGILKSCSIAFAESHHIAFQVKFANSILITSTIQYTIPLSRLSHRFITNVKTACRVHE